MNTMKYNFLKVSALALVCGFVSVSVPEGPSLDFFVPSYGMSRGLCVPGSRVGIAVSGLAIKLGKITSHFIILERL